MKVVLAINSPEPYFPPQVPPRLCYGKKYPYNRMDEIVEYIETEGKKHRYKTKEITTEFLKSIPENQIYSLFGSEDFYYCRKPCEKISCLYRVCEVNTNTPWTIIKDGKGERIEYLSKMDEYVVLDEELNYVEKP